MAIFSKRRFFFTHPLFLPFLPLLHLRKSTINYQNGSMACSRHSEICPCLNPPCVWQCGTGTHLTVMDPIQFCLSFSSTIPTLPHWVYWLITDVVGFGEFLIVVTQGIQIGARTEIQNYGSNIFWTPLLD